jgi:hypothetical protein
MRILVLLLLLANLTLFGYIQLGRWSAEDDLKVRQQVNPEKVRLLTPQQVAALAPAKAAVVSNECLDWGPFTDSERERAQGVLEPFALGKLLTSRRQETKSGYWVYLPPLPSKAAAERRAGELKEAGVTDLYVVTEAGAQKNAISLGVFRTEDAAQAYLASLRSKGVANARTGPRSQTLAQTVFTVRDPQPALVARLENAKAEFSGSEIANRSCDGS